MAGCPLYTNDDFPLSVQQMEDILGKYPKLDAFIPTGGFPQFIPQAYRQVAEKYKARIADGSLALVVADTLPVQMELMKAGLSKGQVGQRPFEMGYKTMLFLKDMKDGKPAPKTRPTPASTSARRRPPPPASASDPGLPFVELWQSAVVPTKARRARGGTFSNKKPLIVERRSLDFAALRAGFARDDRNLPASAGKAAAQRLLTGHLGG